MSIDGHERMLKTLRLTFSSFKMQWNILILIWKRELKGEREHIQIEKWQVHKQGIGRSLSEFIGPSCKQRIIINRLRAVEACQALFYFEHRELSVSMPQRIAINIIDH
jgi:hypothetical protein